MKPKKRASIKFFMSAVAGAAAFFIFTTIYGQEKVLKSKILEKHIPVVKPHLEKGQISGALVPGELIVKFRNLPDNFQPATQNSEVMTGMTSLDALGNKHKLVRMEKIFKGVKKSTKQTFSKLKNSHVFVPDLFPIYKLVFPKGSDVQKIAQEYRGDPNVEYVHPNHISRLLTTPNDVKFNDQWALHNTGQTGGTADADIDAPEAWDVHTGSSSVVVAVIDTGVDWNHPDLAANIWTNSGEVQGNGVDDDGNGLIDDYRGWDFSDADNDPMDYDGHGTHVSGIIGAVTNNSTGVAGVCWTCKIMPVKMFPNAYDDVAANSIKYAVDEGAKVLSNSWGGGQQSQLIEDAINYAVALGAVVVFAAGNDDSSSPAVGYPASFEPVIAVAATDQISGHGIPIMGAGLMFRRPAAARHPILLWMREIFTALSGMIPTIT